MKIDAMPEREIAEIEATAADYGLETYPITGIQLASLIASQRKFKKLADTAAPVMLRLRDQQISREVNNKYSWLILLAFIPTLGAAAALFVYSGASDFLVTKSAEEVEAPDVWVGLLLMFMSVVVPFFLIFYPMYLWVIRKSEAEFKRLKNRNGDQA